MPKPITNPGPPCECHGVPRIWNNCKSKPSGGSWLCRVRTNERARIYSRSKGHLPFGSVEHLERQRVAHLGKQHPPDCGHCAAQTGEASSSWVGDDVGYVGAHHRHRKALGHLSCLHEDESCKGKIHCALRIEAPNERLIYDAENKCFYSPSTEDYMPLCASHHRRYDVANKRIRPLAETV